MIFWKVVVFVSIFRYFNEKENGKIPLDSSLRYFKMSLESCGVLSMKINNQRREIWHSLSQKIFKWNQFSNSSEK